MADPDDSVRPERAAAESATVQLSAPAGAWRPIYSRRLALHATADAIVLAAWRADAQGLTLRSALALLRRQVGETVSPHRSAATAAVLAALRDRRWRRTLAALALALQQGHRAGYQAAQLLLPGDDDSDTASLYAISSPNLTPEAAASLAVTVLLAALRATAKRVGAVLADALDGTDGTIGDAQGRVSVGYDLVLTVDVALSAAYGMGLLAAFLAAGVNSVNWVTAGDGEVCVECATNESSGPYTLLAAPRLPAHPHCRCCLAPA